MALLSDHDGFDRAAYRQACKDILSEVMKTAVYHEARGHWEIKETNKEKISYAIEGAQFYRQEAETQNGRARYYAIEAALKKIKED